MNRITILIAAAFAFAGCGGGGGGEAIEQTAEPAAESAVVETAEAPIEAVTALAAGEGEVLLVGTMGCGHCTFELGAGCAAAMKTADGVVYIMEGIAGGHELFDDRLSEKPITLVGKASEADGTNHVTVRDYRL